MVRQAIFSSTSFIIVINILGRGLGFRILRTRCGGHFLDRSCGIIPQVDMGVLPRRMGVREEKRAGARVRSRGQ